MGYWDKEDFVGIRVAHRQPTFSQIKGTRRLVMYP